MANQFLNMSDAVGRLKIYYDEAVKDQFNEEVPVMKVAAKDEKSYSGLQVNRAVRVYRHTGIGAGSDGGVLPKIGVDTVVQATINAKFNWLRFGITAGMLAATKDTKGAFVKEISYSMETGMNDHFSDLNRQIGYNGTGVLATLNAAAVASNVITVIGRESGEDGSMFLQPGYAIDVYTTGGVAEASSVTINSMSVSGSVATLTLSQNVSVSSGSYVVRANSYNKEIQGLLYSINGDTSGSIYNIDKATYLQWQSNEVDLGSTQLTLDSLQRAWNLGKRRGGAKYGGIFSNFDALRYYYKLIQTDKRYVTIKAAKPDGGFSDAGIEAEFNGIPWYSDKDAPQRIFMVDKGALVMYILFNHTWADETGSNMISQVDTDSWEVRLRFFANLFNQKPSACVALKGYISP